MSEPRWDTIQRIFREAVVRAPDERAAYLDDACRNDAKVRGEVEHLLASDAEAATAFMQPPIIGGCGGRANDGNAGDRGEGAGERPDPLLGRRIGDYHVKTVIGSGGMGTVYEAVQEHPRRTVALKVLPRWTRGARALRRFEFESQLLARLRHRNIAQVFGSGAHDDGDGRLPYFAMEYVPNRRSITVYADANGLTVRERLALLAEVCDAVHHAHQRGIIHRDLKPDNILVDSDGEPKIIDFGIARATDSDLALTTQQTAIGQVIGTFPYMSPEQCAADPNDLDIRSDVYSLGVVLYEMLCGQLPYDVRGSMPEAIRTVREAPAARPSGHDRALRGDVETIVLKALEKDRDRRYQSAGELGRDIERFLNDEPISARPPSVPYQVRMLARRHRALFAAGMVGFGSLAASVVLVAWLAVYFRGQYMQAAAALQYENDRIAERRLESIEGRLENPAAFDPAILLLIRRALRPEQEDTWYHQFVLINRQGKEEKRVEPRIDVPAVISDTWQGETPAAIEAVVELADILPERRGLELAVAQRHRHYHPSVLFLYDTNLQRLEGATWNRGHIQSPFWHDDAEAVVVLAASNTLPDAVPQLAAYPGLRWVIAAIPRAELVRSSVLFPAPCGADLPRASTRAMIAVVPGDELPGGWHAAPVRVDASELPGALCDVIVDYTKPGEERLSYVGTLGFDGAVMSPFRDEHGRLPGAHLPEPTYQLLDVDRLDAEQRIVDACVPDARDPGELVDLVRAAGGGPDAIALAEARLESVGWLTGCALEAADRDGQSEAAYHRALAFARRAIELNANYWPGHAAVGIARYHLGDDTAAHASLARVIEDEKGAKDLRVAMYLVLSLARAGNDVAARMALGRIEMLAMFEERYRDDERSDRFVERAREAVIDGPDSIAGAAAAR